MGWNKITIDTLTSAEAVSYTHLDVYKRQILDMEESKIIIIIKIH